MARVNPNAIYHPRSRKARQINTREKRKAVIAQKQKLHKKKKNPQHQIYHFLKSKLVLHPEHDTVPEDVFMEWIIEFTNSKMNGILGDKKENQLSTTDQLRYHRYKQMNADVTGKGYSFIDMGIKEIVMKVRNWDGRVVDTFASCSKRVYKTHDQKEKESSIAATAPSTNKMDTGDGSTKKKSKAKKAAPQQDAMQDE